jgi:hypothetical protein
MIVPRMVNNKADRDDDISGQKNWPRGVAFPECCFLAASISQEPQLDSRGELSDFLPSRFARIALQVINVEEKRHDSVECQLMRRLRWVCSAKNMVRR